jgi:hypothetical protein
MLDEATEKRMKGMWVFIRQGSASKNLDDLIPMVREGGTDLIAFCTDDREPDTLRTLGHINDCCRRAVAAGCLGRGCDHHGVDQSGALSRLHPPGLIWRRATRPTSWRSTTARLVAAAQVWQRGRSSSRSG